MKLTQGFSVTPHRYSNVLQSVKHCSYGFEKNGQTSSSVCK